MRTAIFLLLAACAADLDTSSTLRPIIDVKADMCHELTGLALGPDGACPAADIRCTPTRCCTDDWEYCCVGVPTPDGPVVICG